MGFWNFLDFVLSAAFIIVIGGCILLAIAGLIMQHREKKLGIRPAPQTGGRPMRIEVTCPHCGKHFADYYSGARPVFFTCSDCYRSFGDRARMTPAQLQKIAAEEADCLRAEQMPGLQRIKDLVYNLARNNGFVSIHNGEVYTLRVARNGGNDKTVLCTYSGPLTRVGHQHIAFLCMQYCRQKFAGLGIRMWLMEHGVGWEWPKY